MNPYILALIILLSWIVLVYALHKSGILKRAGLTLWGPFIMWRTRKGRAFIERLARPKRFWRAYALLSKVICLAVMIFIMGLLLWEATLVTSIPAESAPSPEMILGIPGINPLIPIWYGILGLVVAIIVHEFAHGVLTRVGDLKLKSLGLVFLIFPMGAFVEPDEEELNKTDKKKRTSVFAVGASTNIIIALFFAFLFSSVFLTSATPIREGPVVVSTADDGPAYWAGFQFGAQLVEVNGIQVTSSDDLLNISAPAAGQPVVVEYYFNGESHSEVVTSGVTITQTSKGLPAYEAGMREGMIIASINGTEIRNPKDFSETMENTHPHQTVSVTVLAYSADTDSFRVDPGITEVTLASRNDYLTGIGAGSEEEDLGFLGINSAYIGISTRSADSIRDLLAHPFKDDSGVGDAFSSILTYIALPFWGFAPIQDTISDLFVVEGVLSALPVDVFWVMANCFYWIFWINLMVGMTNVLPAVPLDGGYLFRDYLDSIISRLKKDTSKEEIDRYVSGITLGLAMVVLMLIVWQLIGPRIM